MRRPRTAQGVPAGSDREPSDAALMTALARGDLSALGELYDRHAESVRRFSHRATQRADVADDLTQDVFVALADAAERFDGARSVRSFAIGIAGKLVLRRRRSLSVTQRILANLTTWVGTTVDRTPEEEAATAEEIARYRGALRRLSEAKRVVVLMADVDGMTGPEIAEALELPLGTVWTRLHHARAALRAAIAGRVHGSGEDPR